MSPRSAAELALVVIYDKVKRRQQGDESKDYHNLTIKNRY
jgi:hypothetical protein